MGINVYVIVNSYVATKTSSGGLPQEGKGNPVNSNFY
jgi:hypothetical protein